MSTKPFPLGIFTYIGYDLPIAERIRLIKEAGFDATSLWWGDEEDDYRQRIHRLTPAMVRDQGLILEFVHVAFKECDSFWSENSSDRERAVAQHLAWVQDCADLGIPNMVMHAMRGSYSGEVNRFGEESIARIASAAEDAGITIALENTRRMDCFEAIMSEVDSPNLGFCYDSSHERICTEDTGMLLRRYGDRLKVTHLSDNDGLTDKHWLPGEGLIDWGALIDAFPADTYSGCFSLEVVHGMSADDAPIPAEFLAEAFRRANSMVAMISTQEAVL